MIQQSAKTVLGIKTRSYLWLFAGAFCLFFSNGFYDNSIAPWFCYLFFLRFISVNSVRAGLLVGGAVYAVLFGFTLYLTCSPLGISIAPLIAIYFVLSFLPFLVHRFLVFKFSGIWSTLIFPLVAVILELLFVPLFSTTYSWSKTQHENYPLIQVASITGISGVTFLMAWFAAVGQYIWQHWPDRKQCFKVALPFVLIFMMVMVYGIIRLRHSTASVPHQRVATVTTAQTGFSRLHRLQNDDISKISQDFQQNRARLFSLTDEAVQQGAKLVLWQEYALFVPETEESQLIADAARFADEKNIYLAISTTTVSYTSRTIKKNQLNLFDPQGAEILVYNKVKPLPVEPILAGEQVAPIVSTELGRIAPAICADADYPNLMRQAGKANANLLLVSILDWEEIARLHFQMLNFRAIENGLTILRAGGDGISGAFDYRGKLLARQHHSVEQQPLMMADLPLYSVNTVYAAVGDLFSWICLVFFICILVGRRIAIRRNKTRNC